MEMNPPMDAGLLTVAEKSGFRETGRFEEVERLCDAYACRWPDSIRCLEFGRTPEGRRLLALVVSRTGALSPAEARSRHTPVLMIQACIHPGESDGKDAGFMALRALLEQAQASQLEKFVLLFVPVFNADGHERFAPWNRVNQNGPEAMGWRSNALNLNLNRDYAKADAPEMQAMLRLMQAWDPLLCVDLHVANGADFEHDVSIQVEPLNLGARELRTIGLSLRDGVIRALAQRGSLPLHFYPVLAQQDDPAHGFVDYVFSPRYSTGYWPQRNRFALLVETHAWKDYATRVRISRDVILEVANRVAAEGGRWLDQVRAADESAKALGGTSIPLDYALSDASRILDFRGYAYTREPSAISGTLMTRYDPTQPQIWRVPVRDQVQPTLQVSAPRGGYVVPIQYAQEIGSRLNLHGIHARTIDVALKNVPTQTFRATAVCFSREPFEGRLMASLEGEWQMDTSELAPGSLFVPIGQPNARLLMALLEPKGPDSFVAWGFFNAIFERKEYMESYVAEQVAREMLAKDPALAAEFARKLSEDRAFARDPAARLDFFYQRHRSWDTRFGLYPICRTEHDPTRQSLGAAA